MSKRNVPGKKSMSRKETILALVALAAMTVGLQAKAGGDGPGNGGNAVVVDGKLYLLDLVEAGVQTHPNLGTKYEIVDSSGRMQREALQFAQAAESLFSESKLPKDVLNAFRDRVANFNPLVREQFLAVFGLYSWRVEPLPLETITGLESPLDLSKTTVYQLAYRRDHSILINQAIWDQLDLGNRVALLMHEVIYAMITPKPDGKGAFAQKSWTAREITGDVFAGGGIVDFRNYDQDGSPVLSILAGLSPGQNEGMGVISFGADGFGKNYSIHYDARITIRGAAESRKNARYFGANEELYDELKTGSSFVEKYWKQDASEFCAEAVKYWHGKAVVEEGYSTSRLTLKDYRSAKGPTKYAAMELGTVYAQGLGTSMADGRQVVFPGSVEISFKSISECEAKLRPALEEVAKTVMMSYWGDRAREYLNSGR